ncbi:hypothetical protein ACTD5D_41125 [Nocardia takedensis]|uniref:hypothetical protein n=1 Tax=Nocardia takedensis TaxID=259390 RepID=UPI003F768EE9
MSTTESRPAHEDPSVREIMRRIGTGTSQAERDAAREELEDYLINGPGNALDFDLRGFAQAHLDGVDRTAWNFDAPDAARQAGGDAASERRLDMAIRADFARWSQLSDSIARGDNEYERAQLIERAGEMEQMWATGARGAEWAAMRQVRELWRADPAAARTQTEAVLAHGQHEVVGAQHLSYLRGVFDPQVKDRAAWEARHDEISRLQGDLAAAIDGNESDEIDERIDALMADWPPSWQQFEEEAWDDHEFWREQREVSSERYREIVEARAACRPPEETGGAPSAEVREALDADAIEQELEDSPW